MNSTTLKRPARASQTGNPPEVLERDVQLYLWTGYRVSKVLAVIKFSSDRRTATLTTRDGETLPFELPAADAQLWAKYLCRKQFHLDDSIIVRVESPADKAVVVDTTAGVIPSSLNNSHWHLIRLRGKKNGEVVITDSKGLRLQVQFSADGITCEVFDRYSAMWFGLSEGMVVNSHPIVIDIHPGCDAFASREFHRGAVREASSESVNMNVSDMLAFVRALNSSRAVVLLEPDVTCREISIDLASPAHLGLFHCLAEFTGASIIVVPREYRYSEIAVLIDGSETLLQLNGRLKA